MPVRSLLLSLGLFVCGLAQAQMTVVVSIPPYGSLVEQIAGDLADVTVVLPAGASPHTFEPTPRMAALLAGTDLVVLNGSVDEWLHELVEAANPSVPVFEALELLEDELEGLAGIEAERLEDEAAESEHRDDDEDDHLHEGVNPHVWLDPVLTAALLPSLGEALAEVDPVNAGVYRERAAGLASELLDLDRELQEKLADVAGAPFIPFHDAWPYFARRYGLDLLVEIEPFPGREPSPRYLADAVRIIRESNAPAIFTEVGLNDRPGRVLAAEARVDLRVLDPLGGAGESYQDLLRRNADTIVGAFRSWRRD
jgi:ABC-type Zn uptake system ZnuABC Zn-binding protein ZnuA